MSVECLEFKSYVKGCMLGFFNIYVPKMGIEIFGCSLWQKNGKRWVNLPSREYKDSEGQTKYMPMLRLREKGHYEAFMKEIKKSVDTWCKQNSVDLDQAQQAPSPFPQQNQPPPQQQYQEEDLPF